MKKIIKFLRNLDAEDIMLLILSLLACALAYAWYTGFDIYAHLYTIVTVCLSIGMLLIGLTIFLDFASKFVDFSDEGKDKNKSSGEDELG